MGWLWEEILIFIKKAMQQPVQYEIEALDDEAIESILAPFKGRHVKIALAYEILHFKRALELARKIGFQNINDCLHTAIAEEHCDELCTYNEADFKRIQTHTRLKITIL